MVRANDKLCVLSAEAPINQAMMTDGSAFYQLQEEIRHAFEGMVIDLPRNMMVQHPHLLNDVHVVIVVCEFTLAGTRDAIRILSWLKANAPQARVVVVANRACSRRPGGQPQGFRAFDRAQGRHRSCRSIRRAASQPPAQPAARQGDQVQSSRSRSQLLAQTVDQAPRESGRRAVRRQLAARQLGNLQVARRQEAQGGVRCGHDGARWALTRRGKAEC
jgi:hypothetical protein